MSLPIFQTAIRELSMMETQWSSQLNPLLANPANQSSILQNVSLKAGVNNVINHLLGQKLQGWTLVRKRASASVWDSQDSNQTPQLTLILNTSADVVCDIEVF